MCIQVTPHEHRIAKATLAFQLIQPLLINLLIVIYHTHIVFFIIILIIISRQHNDIERKLFEHFL